MSGAFGFVKAGALVAAGTIVIRPQRSIGPIFAQVTVEEDHDDEVHITQHPVEQGANVADHAYMQPARLRLILGWSDSKSPGNIVNALAALPGATVTAVQSILTGSSPQQVRDVYAKLVELQSLRVPFDVYTGKRKYINMLIARMNQKTDAAHESSMIVTLELQQVIRVSTTTGIVSVASDQQADPSATAAPINSGTRAPIPSNKFDATAAAAGNGP